MRFLFLQDVIFPFVEPFSSPCPPPSVRSLTDKNVKNGELSICCLYGIPVQSAVFNGVVNAPYYVSGISNLLFFNYGTTLSISYPRAFPRLNTEAAKVALSFFSFFQNNPQ